MDSAAVVEAMVSYCLDKQPDEACGLVIAQAGRVVGMVGITNVALNPRIRYAFDTDEQTTAYRIIQEEGWEIAGIFHSHPRTRAYPSASDIRKASEDVPYVIVSLATDPPVVNAFRIVKDDWRDDDGRIVEIPGWCNGNMHGSNPCVEGSIPSPGA